MKYGKGLKIGKRAKNAAMKRHFSEFPMVLLPFLYYSHSNRLAGENNQPAEQEENEKETGTL